MFDYALNFWPLLGAAVAGLVVGFLWYSPFLFGNMWMKLKGLSKKDTEDCNMTKSVGGQFVLNLAMGYVMTALFSMAFIGSMGDALLMTFWLWLGFNATREISTTLWAKSPLKLALIDASGVLATMLVMGAILFQWG